MDVEKAHVRQVLDISAGASEAPTALPTPRPETEDPREPDGKAGPPPSGTSRGRVASRRRPSAAAGSTGCVNPELSEQVDASLHQLRVRRLGIVQRVVGCSCSHLYLPIWWNGSTSTRSTLPSEAAKRQCWRCRRRHRSGRARGRAEPDGRRRREALRELQRRPISMPVSAMWRSGSHVLMSSRTVITFEFAVAEQRHRSSHWCRAPCGCPSPCAAVNSFTTNRCCISGSPPLIVRPPSIILSPCRYLRSSSVAPRS